MTPVVFRRHRLAGPVGEGPDGPDKGGWLVRVTRRGIQLVLGLLWLLDGALQLQPYMFTDGFANQIIAPTGQGQPGFVAGPVAWAAGLILAHPAVWDGLFAAGQLALGIGLLLRPTVRVALAASVGWALAVWYLGEGLGGLAGGHADLLTGAPGAVLLYAVLAAAAWPRPAPEPVSGWRRLTGPQAADRPAFWVPAAWAVLWSAPPLMVGCRSASGGR